MTRSSYKLPYTAGFLDKKIKNKFFFPFINIKAKTKESKQTFLKTPKKKELLSIKQEVNKNQQSVNFKEDTRPKPIITVYQRSSTIIPEMIGVYVKIHTGQKFVNFQITEHTIGYKFGEFALTKKRALYKRKKKR